MFVDDLVDFICDDPSVNTLITGGIYHPHLPVNYKETGNVDNTLWIVFDYTLNENIGCFGNKSIMQKYDINFQIISGDIVAIESLSDLLKNYLEIYPNDWGIDAYITADIDADWDPEEKVYFKTIKYLILY
jgi:hypothetical protein